SWVIGIGGNGTGKPDALIYAMQVEDTPSLARLQRQSLRTAKYLRGRVLESSSPVLVSHHFYYFGNRAITLPVSLQQLIIRSQGCKRVSEKDATRLSTFLSRRFAPGVHGQPNNPSQ